MFSFEFSDKFGDPIDWHRSAKRFSTLEEAATESTRWQIVCWENGWPIAVRLVELLDPRVETLREKNNAGLLTGQAGQSR